MSKAVQRTENESGSPANNPRRAKDPSYLVPFQRGDGRTAIFCFLFVGGFKGEFTTFTSLAPLVGRQYSFYGVIARGTDGVSEPHQSVPEMAAAYIRQIKNLQREGPYLLVGECFSASVAYETAQQLRAQGDQVGMLAFLDARVPGTTLNKLLGNRLTAHVRYQRASIHDSALMTQCRAIRDEVQTLIKSHSTRNPVDLLWKVTRTIVWGGKVYLQSHVRPFAKRPVTKSAPGPKYKHLKESGHTYRMAVRRYERKPYPGKLTIIASSEFHQSNPTMGWNGVRELEVHEVPGKHDTYLAQNLQKVADLLRGVIQKAETEYGSR
jgi:thioesterase domain-containing protein